MKTRHKRIALIVGGLVILGAVVALVLNAFQSNLVFFFSPTQVAAGGAEVSTGGAAEVTVGGGDLAGLDPASVTCVRQGGKISVGSGSAGPQQALAVVRNDYSLARLYAMGADAWSLANHFSQMRQVPGFELNGNTGDLTATQDCVINRKLSWLKYQGGQIVAAN